MRDDDIRLCCFLSFSFFFVPWKPPEFSRSLSSYSRFCSLSFLSHYKMIIMITFEWCFLSKIINNPITHTMMFALNILIVLFYRPTLPGGAFVALCFIFPDLFTKQKQQYTFIILYRKKRESARKIHSSRIDLLIRNKAGQTCQSQLIRVVGMPAIIHRGMHHRVLLQSVPEGDDVLVLPHRS
jgi:hypothetical protein